MYSYVFEILSKCIWQKLGTNRVYNINSSSSLYTLNLQDGEKINESRDTNIHSGIPEELRDRQKQIHEYMLEEAEKDYKRKTKSQERVFRWFCRS